MNDQETRTVILRNVAERLGLAFHNIALLDRALTHASATGEDAKLTHDYETLEFLGDAALSLAIADGLLHNVPEGSPGEYSRIRAAVVNRRTLARLAKELGLGDAIRLGKSEELSGGRMRDALLEDCLEALVGAIYLDQGWETVRAFVQRVFEKEIQRARSLGKWLDYKSKLQHFCQAKYHSLPKFVVIRSAGPDHKKEFEVEVRIENRPVGRGIGHSKKEAEQQAARAALEHEI